MSVRRKAFCKKVSIMPARSSSGLGASFRRQNEFVLALTSSASNTFNPDLRPDVFLDVRHMLAVLPDSGFGSDNKVYGSCLWIDRQALPFEADGYIDKNGEEGRVRVYESPGQIATMMGISLSPQMRSESPYYTTLACGQRLSASGVPEFLSLCEYHTSLQLLVQRDMITAVRLGSAAVRDDVYLALHAQYAGEGVELNVQEGIEHVLRQWGAAISPYLQGILDGTITASNAQGAQGGKRSIRHWTQSGP